jgi:hypothetical protein
MAWAKVIFSGFPTQYTDIPNVKTGQEEIIISATV